MSSAASDYPLKSAPTITLAAFKSVLTAAKSPAASEAAGIYNAFVAQGINPAIGLAIFQHESNYGKAGIAVGRNNLAGSRYYASEAAYGAKDVGGWGSFPSYTADAKYVAALLAGPLYAGSKSFNTAQTFPYRYAPAADNNKPDAYGNAIVAAVSKWGGKAVPIKSTPTSPAKATAAAAHANLVQQYYAAHPKAKPATIGISTAVLVAIAL